MEVALELGTGQRVEEFEEDNRNSLDCLEQTVSTNMDVKHPTGEGSEGSEEHGREKKTNSLI